VVGAAAENHDLENVIAARTPLVFGLLIGLGFLLLLIAVGSPLVAFVGVVTNLASIAAAFGVAKWIFQDGHLAGALNFEPQGFVDAWGPLFFGAMLSGVAMDYTLFLLSSAREHYDLTDDPQYAMRMALRTSGRVVLAAAGVMVAVFLTFALSGLPRRPAHPTRRASSRAAHRRTCRVVPPRLARQDAAVRQIRPLTHKSTA